MKKIRLSRKPLTRAELATLKRQHRRLMQQPEFARLIAATRASERITGAGLAIIVR